MTKLLLQHTALLSITVFPFERLTKDSMSICCVQAAQPSDADSAASGDVSSGNVRVSSGNVRFAQGAALGRFSQDAPSGSCDSKSSCSVCASRPR